MKLIRSEDLREEIGLGNIDTFVSLADSACEQATTAMAVDLRTPLRRKSYVDFWMTTPSDSGLSALRLKLKAGFVVEGSLELGTGITFDVAKADTSLSSLAQVSHEKGYIILPQGTLQSVICARYDAGFEYDTDTEGAETAKAQQLPDWMIQAAYLKAKTILAADPAFENKDGEILDVKGLNAQYGNLILDQIRYSPMARNPTL